MSPDELLINLRVAINALEVGGLTVEGEFDLWMVAGIHPAPGETLSLTLPIRLKISGLDEY